MNDTLTPKKAYELIKADDTYDYLESRLNEKSGKWEIFIGERKEPIGFFDTEDEADTLIDKTHSTMRAIESARQLRSFFGR